VVWLVSLSRIKRLFTQTQLKWIGVMFHIKDEYLNDLEVNPWLRFRNRIIRLIISPYRLTKSLFLITGALVWVALIALGITTLSILDSLPHFEQTGFKGAVADTQTRIESRLSNTKPPVPYKWTSIDQINRELLYAIVMSEDGDFFSHKGIDYDALISALGENIKRREWSLGASTISQQTIKNIYLTESKNLYRKLKEIISVQRLEKSLTKNEILELYLNLIEFGPDIYGIHAAAKYYFNTTPKNINAAQGAFLAILMPSPRKYHFTVFQNQHFAKRHKRKYKRILQDMLYKEYISPKQYRTYLKWPFFKG
jgi:monofunctional biosynthetic peptidoglycan transglycosylase